MRRANSEPRRRRSHGGLLCPHHLLQAVEHRLPVLLRVVSSLLGSVVVLRELDRGPATAARELEGDLCWCSGASGSPVSGLKWLHESTLTGSKRRIVIGRGSYLTRPFGTPRQSAY